VAMAIATASTAMTGDGLAKNLGLIVMACAAMLLAAFAPLILLKHAPVIPGTSTSREGDGVTAGGAARAGRDAGPAARGARQAGRGVNKLSALASRNRQGSGGPVVGGGERPSRTPSPAPTGGGNTASSAAAAGGTSRAGRPNPTAGGGSKPPGRNTPESPSGPGAGTPGTGSGSRPEPSRPGRPTGRIRTSGTGTTPPKEPATAGAGTTAAGTARSASWGGAASSAPTPARDAGAWLARLARGTTHPDHGSSPDPGRGTGAGDPGDAPRFGDRA